MTIEIVSDEEAENADFCICMPAWYESPFSDNEFGVCSKCGCEIMFRPYMPKRPPKICIECAGITRETLQ